MNQSTDILYISHGGGPMPLLGDPGHREMVACLQKFAGKLRKPSAILVVSAHWEARVATITAATQPELIYDYYGFPPESYEISIPPRAIRHSRSRYIRHCWTPASRQNWTPPAASTTACSCHSS